MRRRPPMFALMPLARLAALAATTVTSLATWRRLRRLEKRLDGATDGSRRSARAVLEDHFTQARTGDLDTDLDRNYHPEVVLLTSFGTYHGHDGVRALARRMNDLAPDTTFDYRDLQVHGQIGFLRWDGRGSDGTRLLDGADSYLVRDGRIVTQTIHYRTQDRIP